MLNSMGQHTIYHHAPPEPNQFQATAYSSTNAALELGARMIMDLQKFEFFRALNALICKEID